jgi:hypothetical protein
VQQKNKIKMSATSSSSAPILPTTAALAAASAAASAAPLSPLSPYQQLINANYPFERLLPANSETDPDILMNHIMSISFLADRNALKQQAVLQRAEEYALQKCMLQCKRDGRMKREKKVEDADKMTIDQDQILAQVQQQIDEGKLSPEEVRRYQQTLRFRAALDAIPWPEEKNVDEPAPPAPAVVDPNAPKPFLATSILSAPRDLTEAEQAEQRFEKQKKINASQNGDNADNADDDDEDYDDKPPTLRPAPIEVDAAASTNGSLSNGIAKPLKPAIPADAVAPSVTEEQLALDPENPEIVLQPIKERENRFSYAAKFDEFANLPTSTSEAEIHKMLADKKAAHAAKWAEVDENVGGFVADGSTVPIQNVGAHARTDLPPVYRDVTYREQLMSTKYDPALDKPFLWNKKIKYIVVSMLGPDCPQKCPRRLFRVWGGVHNQAEGEELMKEVIKKNPYGHLWRTYFYSIQRWIDFPPKGDPKQTKGTVAESTNEFQDYLDANVEHQKQVHLELEQRALDAKAGEKTQGQTIVEQLKKKNMKIDETLLNPQAMIPRKQ